MKCTIRGLSFFVFAFAASFLLTTSLKGNIPATQKTDAENKTKNLVCAPPFALKALSVTTTSALLSWNIANTPQESEWEIELIENGQNFTGTPTHAAVLTRPFLMENLNPGKLYFFKMRAVCGAEISNWSNESGTFITHTTNPSDCPIDIPIPDNNCMTPLELGIEVNTQAGAALGVDVILQEVRLIIEHEWLVDLDAYLISPSGVIVELFNESGGTNNNFGNPADTACEQYMTLLNGNACGEPPLSMSGPPYTGRYLPLGDLNSFNDATDPDGVWILRICDDAAASVGTVKFVELVFEPVNCTPPSSLNLLHVDSTFVELDWSPGGFCLNTIFEYGSPGFTPGTGTRVPGGCPPFVLSGLTGGSMYEIYIFEDCGNGIFSNYSCEPVLVQTLCSPPPVSLVENFDNLPVCGGAFCSQTCSIGSLQWFNASDDDQDWLVNTGSTPTTQTGPTGDVSGNGNYIYLESTTISVFGLSVCPAGSEAVLLSNCINIDTKNSDSCHLSFFYHMFGREINSLKLEITEDGLSWNTIWSLSGNQGNFWNQQKVTLSDYNGKTVQFRFVGARGNGTRGDIAIDEIRFFGSAQTADADFTFYLDQDGDGYGDPEHFYNSCFDFQPANYVANGDDCKDDDPQVNTISNEIPCNGIDENCNGIFDDLFLPAPLVNNFSLCEGEDVEVNATPRSGGDIIWTDPQGSFIQFGNPLLLQNLTSNGSSPKNYVFYAQEIADLCFSTEVAELTVTVLPKPEIYTGARPQMCAGTIVNLSEFDYIDRNNTGGQLTFHTDFPATLSNQTASPVVSILSDTFFIIKNTAAGGCSDTTILNISTIPAPLAQIMPDENTLEICVGESVFLTGQFSGGLMPHQISWSTFENSEVIRVVADPTPGNSKSVIFTVTDANNCSSSDSITLNTISGVTAVETSTTDVSACNGNDGSIAILPLDGTPPYSYQWSGPSSGAQSNQAAGIVIGNLAQGSYTVTVLDQSPGACEFIRTFLVVNGPSLEISLDSIRPVSCYGNSDGGIFISANSFNGPIAFLWNNNSPEEDITGLETGIYSVTISDGVCQSEISNILVPQPDSLYATSRVEDVSCEGFADGKIQVQIFGGTRDYEIEWSNQSGQINQSNLATGDYQFTVSDARGCMFVSENMTVSQPAALTADAVASPVSCFDGRDGAIQLNVSGGTPPYNFLWNTGATQKNLSDLSAGNYVVDITDAKGCILTLSNIAVTQPAIVTFVLDSLKNPSCPGIEDGGIFLSVSGGTGVLQHNWNTGATGEDLSPATNGDYFLTTTDQNGCVFHSDTFTLNAPPLLTVDFSIRPPTCVGRADGSIAVNILSTNLAPFHFLWNTQDTTQNIENISSGNYSVTIEYGGGCVGVFDNLILEAEQVLSNDNLMIMEPVCAGDDNGIIFSNILGGALPLTYQWSNGSDQANATNLSAGVFSLTVSDVRGCTLTVDSIFVRDPLPISVRVLAVDTINCHDENTGGIVVEARGGFFPYQYVWNNGAFTGESLSNLPAGNYQLMVQDNRGCLFNHTPILLENPPQLNAVAVLKINKNCQNDLQQDSIFAQVSGGTPPYTYHWNTQDTGAFLPGITFGEYAFTVTDANGCYQIVENIKVPQNSGSFKIAGAVKSDISCFGASDGSVQIQLDGGTPPYQYLWSDGGGDNGGMTRDPFLSAAGLEKGIYKLTVVDSNGCIIISDQIEIREPNLLKLLVRQADSRNVSCHGGRDGRIVLDVSGGSSPYQFNWFDVTGNLVFDRQNPIGLPAGTFKVKVSDFNHCSDSLLNLVITEPDSFYIWRETVNHVLCHGDNGGSISIEVRGGTPAYEYEWAPGGNNTPGIQNLSAGTYSVSVEDAKRCIITKNFTLNQPVQAIDIELDEVRNPDCFGENSGAFSALVSGGTQPYVFLLNGLPISQPAKDELAPGSYVFEVFDNNACLSSQTFSILEPDSISITFTTMSVTPGIGNDGKATASVSGGAPPYRYLWETGDTTYFIENKMPGRYFLTVTDSLGCVKQAIVEIKLMTAVLEINADDGLKIIPNPTTGKASFEFEKSSLFIGNLEIYNAIGQQIRRIDFDKIVSGNISIDLTDLPAGVYWIKLDTESGNLWQPLLKI